ncbi:hypothetical protein [Paenibacillus harenae]|uniref:hypothetical protein n=1 Tax=Paenibacillus harenae TaxID=306543 RepID=UPI0012EB7D0F|nr:hypothetical protein [Paenibacillus harenae]
MGDWESASPFRSRYKISEKLSVVIVTEVFFVFTAKPGRKRNGADHQVRSRSALLRLAANWAYHAAEEA